MTEVPVVSEPLSRDGPEPTYEKVRRLIAEEIMAGRIRAGSRLEPERALCERLGVSRVTLRRGLRSLAIDGLLTPSAGRGWYATPSHLSEPPNALMSFTALARAEHREPTTRVLAHAIRAASPDQADELGIDPGQDILTLSRLRLLENVPVAVMVSRIPLSRAPAIADSDLTDASLYEVLEQRCNITPTRADYTVEAQLAGADIARLLELGPGAPILIAVHTTYDQHGWAIECGQISYRADRYRFRATLTAHGRSWDAATGHKHAGALKSPRTPSQA